MPNRRPPFRPAVLVLLFGLGACGSGEEAEPVPFHDVAMSAFSGVNVAREVGVQDAAAWTALWTEHVSNSAPAPARPEVAFPAQAVAAVFLGEETRCRRPLIEKVERTSAPRILVRYRLIGPGPAELCPAVVMTPVHMVRFANPGSLPIAFRQQR